MGNESGTWIMYGVEPDDPECIHTVDEAIEYINEIGFLPLFRNEIPGFSLEERTVAKHWWSENPEVDPWEWRAIIARSGEMKLPMENSLMVRQVLFLRIGCHFLSIIAEMVMILMHYGLMRKHLEDRRK